MGSTSSTKEECPPEPPAVEKESDANDTATADASSRSDLKKILLPQGVTDAKPRTKTSKSTKKYKSEATFLSNYQAIMKVVAEGRRSLSTGSDYAIGNKSLSNWMRRQFERTYGVSEAERLKIDEMKRHFPTKSKQAYEEKWDLRLAELAEYYKTHGTTKPLPWDGQYQGLTRWVHVQRDNARRGTLRADRRQRLQAVGYDMTNVGKRRAPKEESATKKRGQKRKSSPHSAGTVVDEDEAKRIREIWQEHTPAEIERMIAERTAAIDPAERQRLIEEAQRTAMAVQERVTDPSEPKQVGTILNEDIPTEKESQEARAAMTEGVKLKSTAEQARELALSKREESVRKREKALLARENALIEREDELIEKEKELLDREEKLNVRESALKTG